MERNGKISAALPQVGKSFQLVPLCTKAKREDGKQLSNGKTDSQGGGGGCVSRDHAEGGLRCLEGDRGWRDSPSDREMLIPSAQCVPFSPKGLFCCHDPVHEWEGIGTAASSTAGRQPS